MSRLIKSAEVPGAVVRQLPVQPRAEPVPVGPSAAEVERLALEQRCATCEDALKDRDQRVQALEVQLQTAFADGEQTGYQTGLAAGEDRADAALAALAAGIDQALAAHTRQSGAFEDLALLVARAGLEKILGDAALSADLVSRVVRDQLARLSDEAVLHIEVSARDFPDEARLQRLGEAAGRADLQILARPDAPAGTCRIQLRLGGFDASLDQQRARLCALFDDVVPAMGSQS